MASLVYSVRELQAKLGSALRAAAGGGTVLITSRGRPVAVLSKAVGRRLARESVEEWKLRRMAAEGRLRLGKPGRRLPSRTFPLGGVVEQLLRDRR